MTFTSSGLLTQTVAALNTTAAQATTAVLAPSYLLQGSPQIYATGGNSAYAILQGTSGNAGSQLVNPPTPALQNQWGTTNATAPATGSSGVQNGVIVVGGAQGNGQNPTARRSDTIPVEFDIIYNQLLTMASYISRI